MAEETQTTPKKTYRYVDTDIDLDLLKANLSHNATKYVEHKKWDSSRANEFYSALDTFLAAMDEGRLSSNYHQVLDSQGILTNGESNYRNASGDVLSKQEYDALKRRKQKGYTADFFANREAATYINTMARKIYDTKYKKSDSSSSSANDNLDAFDINKHGFGKYFISRLSPAQDQYDVQAWLDLDKDNYNEETKVLGTANREARLLKYLNDYKTSFDSNKYDFSKTHWKTQDAFIKDLDDAITNLQATGIDSNDYMSLSAIGMGSDLYRALFNTQRYWDAEKGEGRDSLETDAEREAREAKEKADAEKAEQEAAAKARQDTLTSRHNNYYNSYYSRNYGLYTDHYPGNPSYTLPDWMKKIKPKGKQTEQEAWDAAILANSPDWQFKRLNWRQIGGSQWRWNPGFATWLEKIMEFNPNLATEINDPVGNDYHGWSYFYGSLDPEDMSVLSYNPVTRQFQRLFYAAVNPEGYERLIGEIYDREQRAANSPYYSKPPTQHRQGGALIPKHQEGSELQRLQEAYDQLANLGRAQAAKAAQTQSQPGNRVLGKRDPNDEYHSPEPGGWTAAEYMRLGSIGLDILALLDPEPITAGSAGVIGDTLNFAADRMDGYSVGQALGRALPNVGLSLLGAVPILGDTLGSGTKIMKQAIRFAPKLRNTIAAGLVGAGLAGNGQAILDSLDKLISIGQGGNENKMTVDDWRNISFAIQLVVGGSGVAVKNFRKSKLKKQTTENVAVKARNQETGDEKFIIYTGEEDKAALRRATSPEAVNAVIARTKDFGENWKVLTDQKKKHPWSRKATETIIDPDAIDTGVMDVRTLAQKMKAEGADGYFRERLTVKGRANRAAANYNEHLRSGDMVEVGPTRKPSSDTNGSTRTGNSEAGEAGDRTGNAEGAAPRERAAAEGTPREGTTTETPSAATTPTATTPAATTTITSSTPATTTAATPAAEAPKPAAPATATETVAAAAPKAAETPEQAAIKKARGRVISQGANGKWYYKDTGTFVKHSDLPDDLRPTTASPSASGAPAAKRTATPRKKENAKQAYTEVVKPVSEEAGLAGIDPSTREVIQRVRRDLSKRVKSDAYRKQLTNILDWIDNGATGVLKASDGTKVMTPDELKIFQKYYGTDYTGMGEGFSYDGKEYGVIDGKVNLSGIQNHNAGKRSDKLRTKHGADGYDYTDAQLNTNTAREQWQSTAGNREADFMNWVRTYKKDNPNATAAEIIGAYNTAVDSQYEFKRAMGQVDGSKSYKKGEDVRKFNQTNRQLYGSANSDTGVHGYDEDVENINGTTTAQRFIDITDKNINNFTWTFQDGDSEEFKAMFGAEGDFAGLTKLADGRYRIGPAPLPAVKPMNMPGAVVTSTPKKSEPETKPKGTAVDENDNDTGGDGKPETEKASINWTNAMGEMLPHAFRLGRYIATRAHNQQQLDLAKKAEVLLYDPKERHRWQTGDLQAQQLARKQAAQLTHMAAQPVTADGQVQTAAQFSAHDKSLDYIDEGNVKHDNAARESRELAWQQGGLNQESRHTTAEKNKGNIFQKRENVRQAEAVKARADYESLNNLLGEYETEFNTQRDKNKAYIDQVNQASLQNDIASNMAKYGITANATEQQLINDVYTGTRSISDLTADEYKTYARLQAAIEEARDVRIAASKGANYRPFKPATTSTSADDILEVIERVTEKEKRGGVLGANTEKVAIQKLRGRVQAMQTRQKHLEARMNAFEKDLDRAQRSGSQYVRGQLKK